MIYKVYKLSYEKLSKIMDLSLFKNHLNIGKSFSFLIKCNIYANEIESIELCDENSTPIFMSGECESIVDVFDYNNILLGEVYLPAIEALESSGRVIDSNINHSKINALLKIYMENTFKKKIVVNESVLETETVICRFQKIIQSSIYDADILKVRNYHDLNQLLKVITKDCKDYVRRPNNMYCNQKDNLENEIIKDEAKHLEVKTQNSNELKLVNKKSTIKRLEFLKLNLGEINRF